FVDVYGPRILEWCRQHQLQDADAYDVTQSALYKLVEKLNTVEDDRTKNLRGWLHTVTQNVWQDLIRDRKLRAQGTGNERLERLLEEAMASGELVDSLYDLFNV